MTDDERPAIMECALDGNPVDAEFFCYGCKSYICAEHEGDPWGSHDSEDHDEEED